MTLTMYTPTHTPVLLEEAIEALAVRSGARYVDGTLGGGGHARAILERGGRLLGIDADPEAVAAAGARLSSYAGSAILVNDNFANLKTICTGHGFLPLRGVLLDLGLSSLQLEGSGRGFSLQRDEPLDMRFNPAQATTAADIVNSYGEGELTRLLKEFSEERHSLHIARLLIRHRPLTTTRQVADIIERGAGRHRGRIHPATRTFQALRIAVNGELEKLPQALAQAVDLLEPGGRLVVIGYHSLEDRIVKHFNRQEADRGRVRLINKKVITPSRAEILANPRSRSAKLRAIERIDNSYS